MSVYASLLATLGRADKHINSVSSIGTRLLTNNCLVSKIDTKKLVDHIIHETIGENKAEGYRLLCILLKSEVIFEETRLASMFERFPALLESLIDEDEERYLLMLLTIIYDYEYRETIERIEKILNKITNTCTRLIQTQRHKTNFLLSIMEQLLTSSSRNLMQQQAGSIRKACITGTIM